MLRFIIEIEPGDNTRNDRGSASNKENPLPPRQAENAIQRKQRTTEWSPIAFAIALKIMKSPTIEPRYCEGNQSVSR